MNKKILSLPARICCLMPVYFNCNLLKKNATFGKRKYEMLTKFVRNW